MRPKRKLDKHIKSYRNHNDDDNEINKMAKIKEESTFLFIELKLLR